MGQVRCGHGPPRTSLPTLRATERERSLCIHVHAFVVTFYLAVLNAQNNSRHGPRGRQPPAVTFSLAVSSSADPLQLGDEKGRGARAARIEAQREGQAPRRGGGVGEALHLDQPRRRLVAEEGRDNVLVLRARKAAGAVDESTCRRRSARASRRGRGGARETPGKERRGKGKERQGKERQGGEGRVVRGERARRQGEAGESRPGAACGRQGRRWRAARQRPRAPRCSSGGRRSACRPRFAEIRRDSPRFAEAEVRLPCSSGRLASRSGSRKRLRTARGGGSSRRRGRGPGIRRRRRRARRSKVSQPHCANFARCLMEPSCVHSASTKT